MPADSSAKVAVPPWLREPTHIVQASRWRRCISRCTPTAHITAVEAWALIRVTRSGQPQVTDAYGAPRLHDNGHYHAVVSSKRKKPSRRGSTPRHQPPMPGSKRDPGTPLGPLDAAHGGWLDIAPLTGPRESDRTTAYGQAFFVLEEWISAGRPPGKLDVATLPPEHRFLAGLDGPAFEYFRACMLILFEQPVGRRPSAAVVRSLLVRAAALDPAGYRVFIDRAWTSHPRFATQRNNAYRQVRELLDSSGPADEDVQGRLRTYLKAWADYYEVDFVLWFLAVLARGITTHSLLPDAFGGPDTATPQGSLANQVGDALAALSLHQLQALHADAYDPELRNVAGHNDYRIEGHTRADATVVDDKTGRRWSFPEIGKRLVAAQVLGEMVMAGMAWAHDVHLVEDPIRLAQRGVVTTAFGQDVDGQSMPTVVLGQLWCFRDLDPAGTWLDTTELVITVHPDGTEQVSIGEFHMSIGGPVTPFLGAALLEHGWVRVLRQPVAPALGLGHPEYMHPDGARYEVVGTWDEHCVPVQLVSRLPGPPKVT